MSSTTSPSIRRTSPGRTGANQRRSSTARPSNGCGPNGFRSTASRIAIAAVCQPEAARPLKIDFRSSFVKVEGLRIEFGGEALDIVSSDFGFAALVPHADREVVEPLDHEILQDRACKHCAPVVALEQAAAAEPGSSKSANFRRAQVPI